METLLIANRGEIVSRIARTARTMGIRTVGVFSDPDSTSPAMADVDLAVRLAGVTAAETYLDQEAVIAAAIGAGADAIHPGFGFLAENAEFATRVIDGGFTWIGPQPESIALMGDKVRAREAAADAGVPILPAVPVDQAGTIGFPTILKAAAGGGGKGMRVVGSADALVAAIESARGEAERSFGDGTLYAERFIPAARHIEVQVFGDDHGNVVHLYERECSIQRRHQKIIEESPAPGIDAATRAQLCATAVGLAHHLGYQNAGTVEFIVGEAGFHFIEMNTRLQVEHPVTEELTGVDLVEWQLRVAVGEPLPLLQEQITVSGHAIEARLYAEDPSADWSPATGVVHRYRHGSAARYEDSIASGNEITPHYDPMIGKVIRCSPTRLEAARALAGELAAIELHGIATNRDMLVATLRSDPFLAGATTTSFLDDHPELLEARPDPAVAMTHLAAAIWARTRDNRAADQLWGFAPAGWRNVPSQWSDVRFDEHVVRYSVSRDSGADRGRVEFTYGDQPVVLARVHGEGPFAIEIDGMTRRCSVHRVGDDYWINSAEGQTRFAESPRFVAPDTVIAGGGPTAPIPGTVVDVLISVGDHVDDRTDLMVVEAMKMEHRIRPPGPAVVAEVLVSAGDQVEAGQLLVRLEEEEEA